MEQRARNQVSKWQTVQWGTRESAPGGMEKRPFWGGFCPMIQGWRSAMGDLEKSTLGRGSCQGQRPWGEKNWRTACCWRMSKSPSWGQGGEPGRWPEGMASQARDKMTHTLSLLAAHWVPKSQELTFSDLCFTSLLCDLGYRLLWLLLSAVKIKHKMILRIRILFIWNR